MRWRRAVVRKALAPNQMSLRFKGIAGESIAPPRGSKAGLQKRVLNTGEVAQYLGVHISTIYKLLKKKQIPAFRLCTDWRFNIESIDQWRLELESAELLAATTKTDSQVG
jgi:excisionase family DNA binding protein